MRNKRTHTGNASWGRKGLSLLLSLCMLACALPQVVVAETPDPSPPGEAHIVEEAVDRRDATSKTFLLDNGQYRMHLYSFAVNEPDGEGGWKEVDNRLTRQGEVFTTSDGSVTFAAAAPAVTMGDVSWTLTADGGSFAPGEAVNVTETKEYLAMTPEEQLTAAPNASAQAFYVDEAGSGVRYTLTYGKVKEDILLASPEDVDRYTVTMHVPGWTASLCEEGRSVTFTDAQGETALTVDVPYMEDAAEEASCDIALTLTQEGDDVTLAIAPDEAWLLDPARVYPVVIDPVYYTSQTSGITDTMVHQGDIQGTCNCGVQHHNTYDRMYVGNRPISGIRKLHYSYCKINLSSSSSVLAVTDAKYRLHLTDGTSSVGTFSVAAALSSWNESTLTYATQPSTYTLQTDVAHVTESGGHKTVTFDITTVTQGLFDGTYTSHNGLRVGYSDTSLNDYNSFTSADNTAYVIYRPQVIITYVAAGTYYIRNEDSRQYLGLHASGSGVKVYQDEICEYATQKWILSSAGSGYITIKNDNTQKYVRIDGYATCWAETYYSDDSFKFKLEQLSDGTFKIIPKSFEQSGYALKIVDASNTTLQAASYSSSNYEFRWSLFACGSKTQMLGIKVSGNHNATAFDFIIGDMNETQYNSFNATNTYLCSTTTCINMIADSQICIMYSRAGNSTSSQTKIAIKGDETLFFSSTDIPATADFSSCEMVIFAAPDTATIYNTDLPYTSVTRGATVAIGFKSYGTGSLQTVHDFCTSLVCYMANNSGVSVDEAITYLSGYDDYSLLAHVCIRVYGDSDFCF